MVQAFVLSLIWGPVGIALGYWVFSAIVAARSRKEAVMRVLADRRLRDRSARFDARLRRSGQVPALVARGIVRHTSGDTRGDLPAGSRRPCRRQPPVSRP